MNYWESEYFSFEKIRERIKKTYIHPANTVEGSFAMDVADATAVELAQAHMQVEENLRRAFAETSYGEYLDMITESEGVYRKRASYAEGIVTVQGKNRSKIRKGTLLSSDTQMYETLEEVVVQEGKAEIKIRCIELGKIGNTGENTIINVPITISGVEQITNVESITNGADEETDEGLKERYFEYVRIPAASGNIQNYINWARETAGVGRARIFPLFYGNGTVKVVITNAELEEADTVLCTKVARHIEDLRPIGAKVEVESVKRKNLQIYVKVRLLEGALLEEVKEEFRDKLEVYFKQSTLKIDYISYARIGNVLFENPKVGDYTEMTVNESKSNIPIEADEYPYLLSLEMFEETDEGG